MWYSSVGLFGDIRETAGEQPEAVAPVPDVRHEPDELSARPGAPHELLDVASHVEEMLEIGVGDHRVERAVGKRERIRIQVDLLRIDSSRARPLGPDPRDIGADDIHAVRRGAAREETRAAARVEDVLTGLEGSRARTAAVSSRRPLRARESSDCRSNLAGPPRSPLQLIVLISSFLDTPDPAGLAGRKSRMSSTVR